MGVAFRSATTAASAISPTTSVNVGVPAGVQDFDFLLLWAVNGVPVTFNDPTDWTPITTDAATDTNAKLWAKIAFGETGPYTVAVSTGNAEICAAVLSYSGASNLFRDSQANHNTSLSTTSVPPKALAGVTASDMTIAGYGYSSDANTTRAHTFSVPSGWTSRANFGTTSNAGQFNSGLLIIDKLGGTDLPTTTVSPADQGDFVVLNIAISPNPPLSSARPVLTQAVTTAAYR